MKKYFKICCHFIVTRLYLIIGICDKSGGDIMKEKIQSGIHCLMEERHFVAIKKGLLSSYSFLLVGTLFLIPTICSWSIVYFNKLFLASVGLYSMYACFSIGESLGESYSLNARESGLYSVFAYIISILSLKDLSLDIFSMSLFIAIVSSIVVVEILRLISPVFNWNPLPDTIPSAVSHSFLSLLPCLILSILFGIILPQFHCMDLLIKLVYRLLLIMDHLSVLLLVVFFTTYFWFIGIHGATVISMILRPFWICMIQWNGIALIQGHSTFFISPEPLLQWFVWIGGSGTTLGLSFLLRFLMKSQHNQEIGKASWISSLVNINEPVIFGTPIVSHHLMIIPFVGVPLLCTILTWIAISTGWLHPICIMAVWTLPSPLGAFLSTGGDVHALVFNLGLIILSMIGYYPFIKIYDQRLLKEEKESQ